MNKDLVLFLIRAKRKTYAAKGAEVESSRPNSHDPKYQGKKYTNVITTVEL